MGVKYLICFFVMAGCGLTYVHNKQPAMWQQLLLTAGLQQADTASNPTPAGGPSKAASPTPAASEPITFTPFVPVHPEIITPDSTYMTSEHVRQVEQPIQPGAATQQATASSSTSAPNSTPAR